jgi:hypothetical protein
MDNTPPLKMTWHEGMVLAAKFLNKNTNQEIGVFTNQGDFPEL